MTRRVGLGVITMIGLGMLAVYGMPVSAGEHGGKEHGGTAEKEHGGTASHEHDAHEHGDTASQEHGGKEHGGTASQAPSAEAIRGAIRNYVQQLEEGEAGFTIKDSETDATRKLELVRVHERVGKTGSLYYSCTDMQDVTNGELLDLDFDVNASSEGLEVVDVRIHKVDGEARYTYDDQDNRIPLI